MNKAVQPKQAAPETGKPIIFFDGDKGGVGKSWSCAVFCDFLLKNQIPFALVDGDTRNPDVSRMFEDLVPVLNANLRTSEGWMDLTDFMFAHADKPIVVSYPAGIGADLRREAPKFFETTKHLNRPVSMFWVINRLPDSINLLSETLDTIGDKLQTKVVVKNLFFGDSEKFTRWEHSATKKRFAEAGGKTVNLTELHERTVDKLFADNENIMPFSTAAMPVHEAGKSVHKLTPSENMELISWLSLNHQTFSGLKEPLGI